MSDHMSDQERGTSTDSGVVGVLAEGSAAVADGMPPDVEKKAKKEKKPKKRKKTLEERKVYEAGAVIVCDGKVVLRLTDKQRWIFPKGKLKKDESPHDAAVREAIEETGLRVEVIDQVTDSLIYHEGKKRRFVFFLMRATAKTWDWPHHEGRDTFLISPERVTDLVRHGEYSDIWEASESRVQMMCDEPTPFVAHERATVDL